LSANRVGVTPVLATGMLATGEDGDMTWLTGAGPLINEAAEALGRSPDPLSAASALRKRHPDLPRDRAAQVLEQAHLRIAARDRHGRLDAEDLLLTRDGLEQGTRGDIAARRADLLRRAGARRVVDLTAGLGFDARAFADAGLTVTAIEHDAGTAALLAWNLRHWPEAEVVVADATSPQVASLIAQLAPTDVVFVDPARRDRTGPRDLGTGRARPERDPQRWSPPVSFVTSLDHPRVVIKAAPAFSPPAGWHAEWLSHQRTVLECTAWSWPVFDAPRRAVVMGATPTVVEPGPPGMRAGRLGTFLHEPDPAIIRAGLLTEVGLAYVDHESTWLTGDDPVPPDLAPALRTFRVIQLLDGSTAEQRRALADQNVTRMVIKSRDVDVDPRKELARLQVSEGGDHVLVMTRRDGRTISALTQPVA